MTKQELMETYTAEQLAEMVIEMKNTSEEKITKCEPTEDGEMLKIKCDKCREDFIAFLDNKYILCTKAEFFSTREINNMLKRETERLQYENKNCRKALREEREKHDCQIAEYQKKIEELEKKSDFYFPEEPIKIADLMIHGWETSWDYKNFSISELRQIAEHLLVYCNHNGEVEE